jgi:hypothetical protein
VFWGWVRGRGRGRVRVRAPLGCEGLEAVKG